MAIEPKALVVPNTCTPGASTFASVRRMLRGSAARVDSGVRGLRKPGSRGHMVSACGTGKTLIALRTAEALGGIQFLLVGCPPGI